MSLSGTFYLAKGRSDLDLPKPTGQTGCRRTRRSRSLIALETMAGRLRVYCPNIAQRGLFAGFVRFRLDQLELSQTIIPL
jgi:hypothetical protein